MKDVVDFISTQDAQGAWSDGVLLDTRELVATPGGRRAVAHRRVWTQTWPLAVVADPERVAEITRIYVYLCAQACGLTIGIFKDREWPT